MLGRSDVILVSWTLPNLANIFVSGSKEWCQFPFMGILAWMMSFVSHAANFPPIFG